MRNIFLKSLVKLAQEDRNVMLLTADLGYGVFESFVEQFPDQYINVGVAEQNMTGLATGLALEGKVVFTYSIGNFPTLRCLEQIRNDACYHGVNINIVSTGAGFSYGALGMSHHATEDLSIMRSLPGVTIVAPCNEEETEYATIQLAESAGVGYLRLEKITGGEKPITNGFILGKANVIREGDDVSFIVAGGIMKEVLSAADILNSQGISSRIVSMHTVKPLDFEAISDCVKKTPMIITVEENNVLGGLGGGVAEFCMESGLYPKTFMRVGMKDIYSTIVGDQQYLRSYYKMDANALVELVKSKVDGNKHLIKNGAE